MTPFVAGGVSDGQWHTVHLHYYNKVKSFVLNTIRIEAGLKVSEGKPMVSIVNFV